MWETVMKKRFGFLRCIIILSAVVLTFNLAIVLGKYLIYLFTINNKLGIIKYSSKHCSV